MNHPSHPVRSRTTLFLLALVASLAFSAPPAGAGGFWHHFQHPNVDVMTRNMYFGADLTPAIAAQTLPQLLAANAHIYSIVEASDIPARARAVAREIARTRPDLVGLQEVSQWLSGPIGDPAAATHVEYDQLASLRFWLTVYGAPYRVVRSQQQISIEQPAGAPYNKDVRLVDRDVILAPLFGSPGVWLSSPNGANYALTLTIPTSFGPIQVQRGWASVDVNARGHKFRFVNTHLESFNALVRTAQAGELVAPSGPIGSAPGDAVLVGDLNSDPNDPVPAESQAFNLLLDAGLVDTWAAVNPGDPGLTCCFSEQLGDPTSVGQFTQRIDHVLTRGSISTTRAHLVGIDPGEKTASGKWPSDHAGVVTRLEP